MGEGARIRVAIERKGGERRGLRPPAKSHHLWWWSFTRKLFDLFGGFGLFPKNFDVLPKDYIRHPYLRNVIVDFGWTLHKRIKDDGSIELAARMGMTSKEWTLDPKWFEDAEACVDRLIEENRLSGQIEEAKKHFDAVESYFDSIGINGAYVERHFIDWCQLACQYLEGLPNSRINESEKALIYLLLNIRYPEAEPPLPTSSGA